MYSDEDTKIYEDGDDYEEDVVSRPKKVKKISVVTLLVVIAL